MEIVNYSFIVSVNSCISIKSNYNPFKYCYSNDLYYYGSSHRKKLKRFYDLTGKVEDHHIIPKYLEKHPIIFETNFPIHCSKNIKMMPSRFSTNIESSILIHENHHKYNWFMKEQLDKIYTETNQDTHKNALLYLIDDLYIKLNHKDNVPWN